MMFVHMLRCLSYSLLLFSHLVSTVGNSEVKQKCITPSELHERANHSRCISPKEYHYLLDSSHETFTEGCFDIMIVPEGEMTVLDKSSNNIDTMACPEETFQPTPYFSNTQSCCGLKSTCNKTGLVIFSNGSTVKDRNCVCDYRKGYAPTHTLRNSCYCLPKEEDCTCQFVNCEKGSILSADNECVKEEDYQKTTFKCPDVLKDDRYKSTTVKPIVRTTSQTQTNATTEGGGTTTEIKTTIVGLVLACVGFVAGIFLERKKKISECWSTVLSKVDNCNSAALTSVTSEQQEISTKTDCSDVGDSEGMDTVESSPMLTKSVHEDSKNLSDDQDGSENDCKDKLETEEEKASHPMLTGHHMEDCYDSDDCDIMIISMRLDNGQAKKYHQHLEALKIKFNMLLIKIRVLPNDKSLSPKFEKTLKSCRHIFIFVTENFSMETFKTEVDFDHLKEKYFEDHTNIDRVKVVCGDNMMVPAELYALNIISFGNWENAKQTYYNRMQHYFSKALMKENSIYERR